MDFALCQLFPQGPTKEKINVPVRVLLISAKNSCNFVPNLILFILIVGQVLIKDRNFC